MARGFERPPAWAWALMVLGAVWLVLGGVLLQHRGGETLSQAEIDRADAALEAARAADEAAAQAAEPATVLIIGDSYTGGSDEGGNGPASWPQLLANELNAAGRNVDFDVSAAGGVGYVTAGSDGTTFVRLASEAGPGYDVVVFFGSRNDTGPQGPVEEAAAAAFTAVRATSPDAKLLAIGPPWVDADPPGNIIRDRDAVATAVAAAGGTFVDPLAEGWFTGPAGSLIGADGVHPTDEGHRYMAERIRPHLEALLPAT